MVLGECIARGPDKVTPAPTLLLLGAIICLSCETLPSRYVRQTLSQCLPQKTIDCLQHKRDQILRAHPFIWKDLLKTKRSSRIRSPLRNFTQHSLHSSRNHRESLPIFLHACSSCQPSSKQSEKQISASFPPKADIIKRIELRNPN